MSKRGRKGTWEMSRASSHRTRVPRPRPLAMFPSETPDGLRNTMIYPRWNDRGRRAQGRAGAGRYPSTKHAPLPVSHRQKVSFVQQSLFCVSSLFSGSELTGSREHDVLQGTEVWCGACAGSGVTVTEPRKEQWKKKSKIRGGDGRCSRVLVFLPLFVSPEPPLSTHTPQPCPPSLRACGLTRASDCPVHSLGRPAGQPHPRPWPPRRAPTTAAG